MRQKLEHYRAFRAARLAVADHPVVQQEIDEVFIALRAMAVDTLPKGVGQESLHAVAAQLRRSGVMSAAQVWKMKDTQGSALGADAAAAQCVGGRRAAEPRADGVVRSQQVRAGRAGRDVRRAHAGWIGCDPERLLRRGHRMVSGMRAKSDVMIGSFTG